jgi:hypothetical protein
MNKNDSGARPLDWSKLPANFKYLQDPAAKYGIYQFDADRERLGKELSDSELADLADLAERVRQPGEMERIYEWRMQYRGHPEPILVQWLVQILNALVPYLPKDRSSLDWSKLPAKLQYLAEPSSVYAYYWHGAARTKLLEEISDNDLLALAKLAKRIRSPRDWKLISSWLSQYQMMDPHNPEPLLVFYLLVLIDEFVPEL